MPALYIENEGKKPFSSTHDRTRLLMTGSDTLKDVHVAKETVRHTGVPRILYFPPPEAHYLSTFSDQTARNLHLKSTVSTVYNCVKVAMCSSRPHKTRLMRDQVYLFCRVLQKHL